MSASDLVIRGAREHNLRNVDLVIPRNQLVVLTGVSGSGKSSLAFDTVYAEGQRRYVESLSTYARQFLGQMPKPDVDSITGLAPSISIQQKVTSRNPRSTVGTITEIYDYLRVLYARVGTGCCVKCQRPITAQSTDQILESILTLPEGTKFQILAPLVNQQKGEFRDLFADLLKQGYLRARVDGEIVNLSDDLGLKKHFKHTIEVVIDRLVAGKGTRTRLAEAIEAAARLAEGKLLVVVQVEGGQGDKETEGQGDKGTGRQGDKEKKRRRGQAVGDGSSVDSELPLSPPPLVPLSSPTQERLYSTKYACPDCGLSYEPPSPQLFSFNSPLGMCPDCTGLGQRHEFLLDRIIADETKSIAKGALHLLGAFSKVGRWRRHIYQGVGRAIEQDVGLPEDSFLKTPWNELPEAAKELWLQGTGDRHITFAWRHRGGVWKHGGNWAGFLPELLDDYIKAKNPMRRKQLEKFMATVTCSTCHGERLNAQARNVRIEGRGSRIEDRGSREVEDGSRRGKSVARSQARKTKSPSILNPESSILAPESSILDPRSSILSLPAVCSLSIDDAARFFSDLVLTDTQRLIAEDALKEIRGRLGFLQKCGLGYLTLDRTAPTLSGGESQRIRLAGQIGCGLVGVLYVLDEPSIGLHPRDNSLLLQSLEGLRDQGNTVLVVEHDEETMEAADHIIDFGPGPGVRGGEIVAQGTVEEIKSAARSLTGAYLSGRQKIEVPKQRREIGKQSLKIVGARHNNLRGIDVDIPLGVFVCVTGVSGSGKSSLCNDILWEVLNQELNKGQGQPGTHTRINGLQHLDKAIDIDQSPIGRTPRSNPATYVKLFDEIRDLYTQLPQSKVRGYKSGRFSFNVADGRCEACEGHGATKLEMDFLADIWVPCAVCGGQRFNHETLEVKYRDKSIADVLDMDVQEALDHFKNHPKIHRMLQTLHDVGLDYLKLGQPSPTLSGGEAQRIKLARELGKRSTGRTLYLLDEPTTGLHFEDVRKLLEVLHGFADAGNTVLVIEHNLDVVKTADWIIDLGPEGGSGGGRVLATGTPEDVVQCEESHTGRALRPLLGGGVSRGQGDKGTRRKGEKGKRGDEGHERNTGVPSSPLPLVPSSAARRTTTSKVDVSRPTSDAVITIKGAAQHNLQSIDITVPRDQMSVFCGPSGSGKTSLAMDTLYAEGQRRYVESLSAYARQFLGQMPKPKLEHISGLSPAIAIEQKTVGATPRSTVGTVTEIYDYLRILFARLGTMHCPEHGCPVRRQTTDEIVARVLSLPEGTRIYIGAPLAVPVGQSYKKLWDRLGTQGYLRVRINGETHLLEEVPEIDHKREHTVEAIIDRIQVNAEGRPRIADSIETALDLGKGVAHVIHVEKEAPESEWRVDRLSLHYSCSECGGESVLAFEDLSPQNFSFNSPLGWCEACQGLGVEQGTNQQALVASPGLSLRQGAVSAWPRPEVNPAFLRWLEALAAEFEMPLDTPWYQLDPRHQRVVLYGSEGWIDCPPTDDGQPGFSFQYKGLYPAIEEASRVSYDYRLKLQDLVGEKPCSVCNGDRVRPDAAAVRLENHTLPSLCKLPLVETLRFLESLPLTQEQQKIAGDLLNEATHRLKFLVDVGLHYLTLDRGMPTLSGGESQRIRLAGQIGRALTGVLYVLDEPTIGLHPRDNGRLIEALHRLRDLGNTVVLVEHDQEVLASADRLYDFGPGSGRFGGTVTAEGTPQEIVRQPKKSLTGAYLSGEKAIPIPTVRRMARGADGEYDPPPGGAWLEITNCRLHNLRGVNLRIPLGALTCVTGLSGSGKSSLIQETLARAVARKLNRTGEAPGPYDELRGVEQISRVINVDQAPIGMTPASNPATYVGVFDPIRDLFSKLPDAKIRGYKPGRFSFNRPGGRCEECEGLGQKKIEMHFLPDVWVTCDACRGHRYNAETLAVRYKGSSISDVLNLSIGQALELFGNIPKIRAPLATLAAIGLDYLTLGQSATTLSGGEAQRVKLAAELCKPNSGRTLYLLDEPTTGLHMDDIAKLLMVLGSLVEQGNTVVVIEHNLDVIKTADWVVDIGPEAGIEGGQIVVTGTPEEVVEYARDAGASVVTPEQRPGRGDKGKRRQGENSTVPSSPLPLVSSSTAQRLAPGVAERVLASPRPRSYTGELLAPILAKGKRGRIEVFDVAQEAAKRSGDVDIAKVGKEAALPWKVDGRKWHTQDRPARNGKVCKWEGAALEFVVDLLGEYQGLKEVNWNDPSTVEITAEQKTGTGWFFHALTGDEWLVRFYFRVPKKTFVEEQLARDLNLTPVDELDEVQVYGRGERVKFNNSKGPFQEVVIDVYRQAEIDTPAFRDFIEQAVAHYVEKVEQQEQAPAEAIMPWKVLGKKWHLSRKGFPSNKRIYWSAEVLEKLLDVLEQTLNGCEADWSNKTQITWKSAARQPLVELQTKRREGLFLTLLTPPGRVALGQIADLGAEREIAPHRRGQEAVRVKFTELPAASADEVAQLLRRAISR